jgi:hypothetical protein
MNAGVMPEGGMLLEQLVQRINAITEDKYVSIMASSRWLS